MDEDKDKIYGLIVQAQEMQKYALEYRGTAEDVLQKLPEAVKDAVSTSAMTSIKEGAQKGLDDLSAAFSRMESVTAKADTTATALKTVQEKMTGAWILHALWLLVISLILAVSLYAGVSVLVKIKAGELQALETKAEIMRETIQTLRGQYGATELILCDGRPCVRVDKSYGSYQNSAKPSAEYMVIFGY